MTQGNTPQVGKSVTQTPKNEVVKSTTSFQKPNTRTTKHAEKQHGQKGQVEKNPTRLAIATEHNMTELQRAKLIQEEHDAKKKTQGGTGANQYTAQKEQSGENLHSAKHNKIRSEIAEEHHITPGAVKAAVEVGRGIDRAAEVDPEFKREVLSGEEKTKWRFSPLCFFK